MIGRREEAEVIVRLDQFEQAIHICVHAWPAMYRKMFRLYGQSRDGANPKHSARWIVPLKAITFRRLESITKVRKPTGRPFPAAKHAVKGQSEDLGDKNE